jgi:hypothetical protein
MTRLCFIKREETMLISFPEIYRTFIVTEI